MSRSKGSESFTPFDLVDPFNYDDFDPPSINTKTTNLKPPANTSTPKLNKSSTIPILKTINKTPVSIPSRRSLNANDKETKRLFQENLEHKDQDIEMKEEPQPKSKSTRVSKTPSNKSSSLQTPNDSKTKAPDGFNNSDKRKLPIEKTHNDITNSTQITRQFINKKQNNSNNSNHSNNKTNQSNASTPVKIPVLPSINNSATPRSKRTSTNIYDTTKKEVPIADKNNDSEKSNSMQNNNDNNSQEKADITITSSARTRNQRTFAARQQQAKLNKQQQQEKLIKSKQSTEFDYDSKIDSSSSSTSSSSSESESDIEEITKTKRKTAASQQRRGQTVKAVKETNVNNPTKIEEKLSKFDPSTIDVDAKDDYCGICGHSGNLVVCAYCVCAYHFICLNLKDHSITVESLPDDWNCTHIPHRKCTTRKPKKMDEMLSEEESKHFKWLSTGKKANTNTNGITYYTKFERADEIYNIGDCALFAAEENLTETLIGEILSMFEDKYNGKWVEVRWYWIPEETKYGRLSNHGLKELFSTAHVDEVEIGSLQCKVTILNEDEYKLRELQGATDEYVFYCNKRYNNDTGEFRPIIQNTDKLDETILLSGRGENKPKRGRWANKHIIGATSHNKLYSTVTKIDSALNVSVKRKLDDSISSLSPYELASSALQLSSVPLILPCRESEKSKILDFLTSAINRGGLAGGLYLAGTGKTATVRQVIRELKGQIDSGLLSEFDFIELNGMKLPDPLQLYSTLWYELKGKHVSPNKAVDLLDNYFKTASSRRNCLILLVDELDSIINKKQDVIYNLFDWPTRKSARLVVIGISNTMDLPELLMPRVHSRLGLTRIPFKAYTRDQIITILQNRLNQINNIFEPDAFQLCAMKVASVSGDIRRALQICRRAVECAEYDNNLKKKKKTSGNTRKINSNNNSMEIDSKSNNDNENQHLLVNLHHIERACADLVNSNTMDFLRECALYEKMFLYCLLAEFRHTRTQQVQFLPVAERCERICGNKGIQPIPNKYQFECIMNRLTTVNILSLENKYKERYPLISLCGLLPDDVSDALANDDLFSQ